MKKMELSKMIRPPEEIVYDELDPACVPLVRYFNSHGLPTFFSCEGHPERPGMDIFRIDFQSSVTTLDIVKFQSSHLNRHGVFHTHGKFSKRLVLLAESIDEEGSRVPNSPVGRSVWWYSAATVVDADRDLRYFQSMDDARRFDRPIAPEKLEAFAAAWDAM